MKQIIIEPSFVNTGDKQRFAIEKQFNKLFVRGNRQSLLAMYLINLSELFITRGMADLIASVVIRCSVNLDNYTSTSDGQLSDWVQSNHKQQIIITLDDKSLMPLLGQSVVIEWPAKRGIGQAIIYGSKTDIKRGSELGIKRTNTSDDVMHLVVLAVSNLVHDIDYADPHRVFADQLAPIKGKLTSLLAELS